jgi:chemotaxis protein CheC
MDEHILLTELECDAIVELLNIGMGQAANSLSEMVQEEVKLAVPSLELLSRQEAISRLNGYPLHKRIAAVKQHFDGPFCGDALLLFPQEKSLELVRALMKGEEVSLEMLTELEQDALTEVGNIILNSCLGSLANLLTHELTSELPIFITGTATEVLDACLAKNDDIVMFLRMDFALHSKDICGYVAFILEIPAIERFKISIDNYLGLLTIDY